MPMTDYGRIGRDAELRYTPNGNPVINLAVAVDYGRKDDATGKRPTQWVEVAIWGPQAEALSPYLVVGQGVQFTIDDVHIEEFTHQGAARSKLVGRSLAIKLVGGAPEQGQQAAPRQNSQQRNAAPQQQRSAAPQQQRTQQQPRQAAPQQQAAHDFDDFDDDIPFN